MRLPRAAGILLHPTSLPGPYGVGDLGSAAESFASFLASCGQRHWQMLPLGPPVCGDSPYQAHSSHAGNPLLISPERLVTDGLLKARDLPGDLGLKADRADFAAAARVRLDLLRRAFERFSRGIDRGFELFRVRERYWLADFCLFMAIKGEHQGAGWNDWDKALAARKPAALDRARKRLADEIAFHEFVQYVFDNQWRALRNWCRLIGITLIGDLPIFLAQDSAEVWARPDLFQLDSRGLPTHVAGVPPDYFNELGQLWGNPLYRWEAHEAEGFAWWIERIRGVARRFELVRLDHFRGFEAYYRIPASAPDAREGKWEQSPGTALLTAARAALGGLPLIAEDLGFITPEVETLRDQFGLPGMRVLQFAFGAGSGAENYLPYKHHHHSVIYTGTHDNDTTVGWFRADFEKSTLSTLSVEESKIERAFALRFMNADGREIHWSMIRLAMSSPADTVIVPLQDVLGLGSEARMNTPGEGEGNWLWRFREGDLTDASRDRLADLTALFGRWSGGPIPLQFRTPRDGLIAKPFDNY